MTYNVVAVTIAANPSPSDPAPVEGNYVFTPSGVMWPSSPGNAPVVPMSVHGVLQSGTATANLVASDNFAVNVLNWDCIINIRGLPSVVFSGFPVNFASGATQSIWTILAAAGWAPVVAP